MRSRGYSVNNSSIGSNGNSIRIIISIFILFFLLLSFILLFINPISADQYQLGTSRGESPPEINITHPAMDAKVSGTIEINGTAIDNGTIKWVRLVIKEVHYNATDTSGNGSWYTWNYSLDTTKYSNGDLRIKAVTFDGAHDSHDILEIIINNSEPENQKPVIWIETPANNTEVKGIITIKGHAKDDDKVRLVDFEINNKEYQATDTSSNSTWWSWKLVFDTTKLENEEYWFTAWAWDNETGGNDSILLIVNNTENHWPYVTITHPKSEATVSGAIVIKGHAWDNDGNVTLVQVRIAEVWYNATDDTTNSSWYNWSLKFNTTKLKDGENKVTAISKDDGGKLGDWHIWIVVKNAKENLAPHIYIEHPKNNTKVSGLITFKGHAWDDIKVKLVDFEINKKEYKATDTSGNGTWWSWKLIFNTTVVDNGKHWVTAWAWDNVNKGGSDKICIIVNNTKEKPKENHWPYVNFTHPTNEATVSGIIIIKGHAWDVDGKVTLVQLKIGDVWYNATDDSGNSSWYKWSLKFDTTKLKDGEHKVVAISKDNGGKLGDEGLWIIVKNKKENKAPFVIITVPKKDTNVSGVITIKGKAWDIDGNVTKVKVRINEVWYEATDDSKNGSWYTWSLDFNTTKLKNGEYKITAAVYDGVVWEDAHIFVNVQNKLPAIQILSPTSSQVVSGEVNVTGKAWGPRTIISVKVRIGDKHFNATDTSGNDTWYTWKYVWNTSGYEDGDYKITAILDDEIYVEDTHVEIMLNNTASNEENNEKPKKKSPSPLPGFDGPILVVGIVSVVVAFFRSRRGRP